MKGLLLAAGKIRMVSCLGSSVIKKKMSAGLIVIRQLMTEKHGVLYQLNSAIHVRNKRLHTRDFPPPPFPKHSSIIGRGGGKRREGCV